MSSLTSYLLKAEIKLEIQKSRIKQLCAPNDEHDAEKGKEEIDTRKEKLRELTAMEIREIYAKNSKKNEIHEPKIEQMDKKIKCPDCEYRTDKNTLLRMHTESLHMKLVKWRCSSCDYKSYHKSMMDYHRNKTKYFRLRRYDEV